jgi:hypothetical protein
MKKLFLVPVLALALLANPLAASAQSSQDDSTAGFMLLTLAFTIHGAKECKLDEAEIAKMTESYAAVRKYFVERMAPAAVKELEAGEKDVELGMLEKGINRPLDCSSPEIKKAPKMTIEMLDSMRAQIEKSVKK